jgi:ectoine hydroxylase-related dioxygenase (phytanoyl-CoA dioxygenase family)
LSVWIPFGDATLDNGCMYLLPKNAVTERIGRLLPILKTVSRRDLFVLLQSSRALPASAGSVLGWESGVIHWGSSSESAASQARASVALEFIRDGIKEPKPKVPFVDPRGALPAFERRLNMIGRAIVSYEEFEPRMLRYSELARRLVRETDLLS